MYKQPSPMSLPIARLRSLGARVSTLPWNGYRKVAYRVTLPNGRVIELSDHAYNYKAVIQQMDDLSDYLTAHSPHNS